MKTTPYLQFNGTCETALKFYEKTLGAKLGELMVYGKTPMAKDVPEDWQNKIIHTQFSVGASEIMASDCMPDYYKPPQGFFMAITVETPEAAEKVFAALSEGGRVNMPLQQTFWAKRFGMLVDKFSIPWSIDCQ